MSYAKTTYKRSNLEIAFIALYLPLMFIMYVTYKWPEAYVKLGWIDDISVFWLLGKKPGFWYSTLYTAIVSFIAASVLFKNKSPYKKGKNHELSKYQRNKFATIFVVQLFILYLLPYYIVPLLQGMAFFADPIAPQAHDAYVYISKAFTSWGGMFYVFVAIPISVYFFGKRYCAWFCACGNLAETIGVTKWGAAWVKHFTPTGERAKKMESLQTVFMFFGIAYGIILFLDFLHLFSAPDLAAGAKAFQDIAIDFIFGAIIGVGAYPFLGTRIWCRYGCPLAKLMELQGKFIGSKFSVAGNDKCKGLNLCSQVCPMGIDVASYVHEDKKPTLGGFSLKDSPCIGCGGCIDICPVKGIEFKY